ncbi:hypothetical protein BX266_5476 [Streptomyces sp. TLI_171]|nr:hypothetical protein BX266_5476 [Streptomyces sp. TLI_171]
MIKQLPEPETVRARSKAMAMLDAVLSPEWQSYETRWAPGEEIASMRDGSGNDYVIVFSATGVYAQACNHESPISAYRVSPPTPWPGLFDSLAEVFRSLAQEPVFEDSSGVPRATVCLWRERTDCAWRCGDVLVPDWAFHP